MKRKPVLGSVRNTYLAAVVAALFLVIGCSCGAQVKALPVGSTMPNFTLKDCNGQEHTLAALKGKIVVLDFCSQECPYSRGVDGSLPELVKTYGDKGVIFLGVDSHKSTTPDQIKKYAAEKAIPLPILKDENNAYADTVGATRTPEFYVLDKDHKLAYHGAYDDRKVPEKKGDTPYVQNALDDLLAGKPVKTVQVEAWGCTIKRK